jgi:hypothetical protein
MPVAVTRAGGRLEVDVVGAKVSNKALHIIHVEVGGIAGGPESVRSLVKKKFSPKVKVAIVSHFRRRFGFKGRVVYQKRYVATYSARPTREEFRRLGVGLVELQEFLTREVLQTIRRWKKKPMWRPKISGKSVQLPESHWLLRLLEYLDSWGIIQQA